MTAQIDNLEEAGRIPLEGLPNTRDISYLQTESGKRIQPHRLIRSGALEKATAADLAILGQNFDVKTVVDLRTDEEQLKSPDPKQTFTGVTFLDVPILGFSTAGVTREDGLGGMAKALFSFKDDPKQVLIGMYPDMLLEPMGIKGYKQFFKVLLENEDGAVLWHCSAGKDRAGLASVMTQYVLGVGWDAIVKDYLATNIYIQNRTEDLQQMVPKALMSKKIMEAILVINSADMDYLNAGMNAVKEKYGSLDAYLEEELGVDAAVKEELQNKYLV